MKIKNINIILYLRLSIFMGIRALIFKWEKRRKREKEILCTKPLCCHEQLLTSPSDMDMAHKKEDFFFLIIVSPLFPFFFLGGNLICVVSAYLIGFVIMDWIIEIKSLCWFFSSELLLNYTFSIMSFLQICSSSC